MKLMTKPIELMLIKNHNNRYEPGYDPRPALKLFNPCGAATWLITEYDPESGNFYGLADLGFGFPELGDVCKAEIEATRLPFGLKIERDMYFKANKTLAEYATEARDAGRIAA